MNVRVTAQIAVLAHVNPSLQLESQWVRLLPGQVHLGFQWKRFEAAADFDNQSAGMNRESKSPIHVTPAFPQILHMGVFAFDFEDVALSVRNDQSRRNRLASPFVDDLRSHAIRAGCPVGEQQEKDHRATNSSAA